MTEMKSMGGQIFGLVVLAIPIACVARTVVYEEIFREPREWCKDKSKDCSHPLKRKFFYLFTCEYCFSHYVTAFFIAFTGYKLLMDDWRGYVIAFFALVFLSNAYLNLYGRMRLEIQKDKAEIKSIETDVEVKQNAVPELTDAADNAADASRPSTRGAA